MPYQVIHDAGPDIATVTFTGVITRADLQGATAEAAALQRQKKTINFVIDANGWDVSASLFDIYELVENQYWREQIDRRSRIAVILPTSASAADAARFYETVCVNRGWIATVFPDRQSAVKWLTS